MTIQRRFGTLIEEAGAGGLQPWEDEAASRLALILVCDQFTRSMYRGTAQAFSLDGRALHLCHDGLERGFDRRLGFFQRTFFYLPLEHAENGADQDLCVACYQRLVEEAPSELTEMARSFVHYADEHREIVRQFGRFPHRNKVLGREPTPEEEAFLSGGGANFGQG